MAKLPDVEYSPELIFAMRQWAKDCLWADVDEDEVDELPATAIARGVEDNYEGGIPQFIEDGA